MSNVWAVVSLISFLISIGTVYADNPTPFETFDFNFTDIEIFQNPNNLRELIIKPHVFFEGNEELGSVNLEVMVTDPDGYKSTYYGRINDMKSQTETSTYWAHRLLTEGIYTIDFTILNTSIEYPNHIFEKKTILHTVDTFERNLDHVVFVDEDGNDVFMLRTDEPIKKFERVHITFDLPQQNLYDGIGVTNGEFKKTFDVGIKDLFLKSEFGYDDLEIYLIQEGNLFKFVNAQNDLLDYVTFYAIHKNICYSETCESVDYVAPEKPDDLEYWILIPVGIIVGIVVGGSVIHFLKRKKNENNNTGWGKPYMNK